MKKTLNRPGVLMVGLTLAAAAAGCATDGLVPAPAPAQVTAAESAVRSARQVEGHEATGAVGQHLRLAEQALAEAKERTNKGDNRAARLLLARAEADAELSQVIRQREKAIAEAEVLEAQLSETRAAAAKPGSSATAPATATTETSAPATTAPATTPASPAPAATAPQPSTP
jgi:Domain of unknown function (DUF4398)